MNQLITNTPWTYMEGKTLLHIESSLDATVAGLPIVSIPLKNRADADAIITAVNGTFGKSLDPTKYEEVVNALGGLLENIRDNNLENSFMGVIIEATAALSAARINTSINQKP